MKTVKDLRVATSVLAFLMCAGCNSAVPAPESTGTLSPSVTTVTPPKPEIAIRYDWRGNWSYQDQRIVSLDQGDLAGDDLAVCHASLIAEGKISNRLADKCDRIAARGLAIQKRQQAEEKRKDDAYDKAHPKDH